MRAGQTQLGNYNLRSWGLGSVTEVMGEGGLFVSSHVGHGLAYYGGPLYFGFTVLFVMLFVKTSYDEVTGVTTLSGLGALYAR